MKSLITVCVLVVCSDGYTHSPAPVIVRRTTQPRTESSSSNSLCAFAKSGIGTV